MHFIFYRRRERYAPSFLLFRKMMLVMRLTALLLVISCLHVAAKGLSQKVTLSFNKVPLSEVIREIGAQTGVSMIYNADQLKGTSPVTVTLVDVPLKEALAAVLKQQPFTYEFKEGTIVIKKLPPARESITAAVIALSPPDLVNIWVRIQDSKGAPVAGASLTVKGSKATYVTNGYGFVSIEKVATNAVIVISAVGFIDQEFTVHPNAVGFTFQLKEKVNELATLEINTGITKRSKESFTGAATTFTGDQLRVIGNRNILESLKTLDPSFIKVENNLQGSNPNRLPTIEVRGKTTLTNANLNDQFRADPNQPLFILDGFESTLQAIYDLDMTRVASITLLKDAASTSLYGSKAANGVVVVETKRPIPGQLRASYTGDFSFELPDLSSYNLMNAAENLQWESLTGDKSNGNGQAWRVEERNAARRADVARGVNTYWLSEPVRTGFSNKHSIQVNGGNSDLMFNGGALYSTQAGAMKGSKRDNWSGNMNVTYRKGKFNIVEMAMVSGNTAVESPYGSFSNFASANPYYRKTNPDGTISKKLDNIYDTAAINPLYNASLYSINEVKTFTFINNLSAIYRLSNSFRIEAGLQLSKGNATAIVFVPPDNTEFDQVIATQKGRYTNRHTENSGYTSNVTLAYGKAVGRSQFTAVARGQLQSASVESLGFSVVGYPYGTNGNPIYAYGFTPYSVPTSAKVTTRSAGFTTSFNYSFDNRYMADIVYTLNGSSAFGSNKRYKPFASAGLGWNLSREAIFRKLDWINLLKLRGNIGYSGNENLGSFTSVSTYSFVGGSNNNFGQGLSLASLGSPNLEWSRTLQGSYGVDFGFFNGRVSGTVEYFRKRTDPLSVGADGTLPSSVAVNNRYVINVGTLTTKGWNLNVRYSPIYDMKKRIVWTITLTGAKVNSLYGGFANRLASLNKIQQDSRGLARFYDGYSPDDIWAVVSRGIDPATGKELFEKRDGTLTNFYDPADIVRVGNTRSKWEGVVGTSFSYKEFSFSANARYKIGGYVFNSALYSKVENIGALSLGLGNVRPNLDKRALYNRWQKPGDVSEFSSITELSPAPMSSRFVQKESNFIGESFSLSWRSSAGWVKKLHVQSLGANLYLNDIFRIESVLSERGLEYPFARSAGFSVNVSF